jgi:hypothetical protein
MRWSQLQQVGTHKAYGSKLNGRVDAINEQIARILTNRAGIDESVSKTSDESLESLNFDNLLAFPATKAHTISVLQEEIHARRELSTMFKDIRAALRKAHDAAIATHEKVQAELRQALVGLGYVDAPVTLGVQGTIEPGWIMKHPKVREARGYIDELAAMANDASHERNNEAELGTLLATLAAIRDRAAVPAI